MACHAAISRYTISIDKTRFIHVKELAINYQLAIRKALPGECNTNHGDMTFMAASWKIVNVLFVEQRSVTSIETCLAWQSQPLERYKASESECVSVCVCVCVVLLLHSV